MSINSLHSDHYIQRDGVRVPLQLQGQLSNKKCCKRLYNIHTNSPILQQIEVQQGYTSDANYTKIDTNKMVNNLGKARSSKRTLTKKLKEFSTLF